MCRWYLLSCLADTLPFVHVLKAFNAWDTGLCRRAKWACLAMCGRSIDLEAWKQRVSQRCAAVPALLRPLADVLEERSQLMWSAVGAGMAQQAPADQRAMGNFTLY